VALDPARSQTHHEAEIDIVAAVNQSFALEVLEGLMIAKTSELATRSTYTGSATMVVTPFSETVSTVKR